MVAPGSVRRPWPAVTLKEVPRYQSSDVPAANINKDNTVVQTEISHEVKEESLADGIG